MCNNSRGIEEETMCFTLYQEYGFKRTSPDALQNLQKLSREGLRTNSCHFQKILSKNFHKQSLIPIKPSSYKV